MNNIAVSNGVNGKRYLMKVKYTGSWGLKDLYRIAMEYPNGSESVDVEYEGKRLEIFDDGVRKMILRPAVKDS